MNTAAQGGGASFFNLLIMFVAIYIIIMMFTSSKGQKKREQDRQAKLASLQKGDQVILQGGIIGTIVGFKDNALEIKVAENVKLTVLKSGIVGFVFDVPPANKQGGAN